MDEQEVEPKRSQDEPPEEAEQNPAADDGTDLTAVGDARDSQEGQAGDALAWIEGPAFSSPFEEMPTLQWPEVNAEVGDSAEVAGIEAEQNSEQDELRDAIQWLEGLAKEQGTPIDEMPTLISGESDQELVAKAAAARGLADLGYTTPPPVMDSDPMAWLEQLAIDQNSPLEELPSVADRLLASEIASNTTLDGEAAMAPLASQPVELEEALKYLEEQAAAEGVALNEITFDEGEAAVDDGDGLDIIDKLVTTAAIGTAVKHIVDSPSDDDESDILEGSVEDKEEEPEDELAWLGELADEDIVDDAANVVDPIVEDETAEGAALGAAGAVALEKELGSEDQEVVLSAVESVEDQVEEEDDGSPLMKGAATAGAAKAGKALVDDKQEVEEVAATIEDRRIDGDTLEGMPDDPDEAMAWIGALGEDEDLSQQPEAFEGQATASPFDGQEEEKDGSLLKKGIAAVSAAKLAKSITGDKEEEAVEPGQAKEGEALDQDILEGMPEDPDEAMTWMVGLAAQDIVEEELRTDDEYPEVQEEPASDKVEASESVPGAEFEGARAALNAGDVSEATRQYRDLLDSGQGGRELIRELETAASVGEPELLQLLGDAYMQDGQMQKALETYNQGFDQ